MGVISAPSPVVQATIVFYLQNGCLFDKLIWLFIHTSNSIKDENFSLSISDYWWECFYFHNLTMVFKNMINISMNAFATSILANQAQFIREVYLFVFLAHKKLYIFFYSYVQLKENNGSSYLLTQFELERRHVFFLLQLEYVHSSATGI